MTLLYGVLFVSNSSMQSTLLVMHSEHHSFYLHVLNLAKLANWVKIDYTTMIALAMHVDY